MEHFNLFSERDRSSKTYFFPSSNGNKDSWINFEVGWWKIVLLLSTLQVFIGISLLLELSFDRFNFEWLWDTSEDMRSIYSLKTMDISSYSWDIIQVNSGFKYKDLCFIYCLLSLSIERRFGILSILFIITFWSFTSEVWFIIMECNFFVFFPFFMDLLLL